MKLCFVFLILTCACLGVDSIITTIELVHVLFRHGDRTPDGIEMNMFPNYPEVNNTWYPIGRGHLTNEGILHMFKLGEALRTNYRNFLLGIFDFPRYETVRTFTTEFARTRASALAFLAGMLPPADPLKWGRERDCVGGARRCNGPELAGIWRPTTYIPDAALDRAANVWANCPAYMMEFQRVQSLPEAQNGFARFHRLTQIMSANLGRNLGTPLEVLYVKTLYESQEAAGIPKPRWAAENWKEILEFADFVYQTLFHNDIQKRFGAGVLLKKILDDSQAKARGAPSLRERRMQVYSGHDTTLVPMFAALGGPGGFLDGRGMKYPIHAPDYTAALAIELHRHVSTGQYSVKFFYTNGDRILRPLRRSDCPTLCPLDDLVRLTQAITFDTKNIEQDCDLPPEPTLLPPSTFPTATPSTLPPVTTSQSSGGTPEPGFPVFRDPIDDEAEAAVDDRDF